MPSGAAWALHFLTLWGLGIVALYWDARFLDKIHRQLLGETFSGGRRGGGREVGLELSCGCAGHGRVPPPGFCSELRTQRVSQHRLPSTCPLSAAHRRPR